MVCAGGTNNQEGHQRRIRLEHEGHGPMREWTSEVG